MDIYSFYTNFAANNNIEIEIWANLIQDNIFFVYYSNIYGESGPSNLILDNLLCFRPTLLNHSVIH